MADSDGNEAITDQPSSAAPEQANAGDTSVRVTEGVASAISANRITGMQLNSRGDESAASSGSAADSPGYRELTVSSTISAERIVSIEVAGSAEHTVARPAASVSNGTGTGAGSDSAEG